MYLDVFVCSLGGEWQSSSGPGCGTKEPESLLHPGLRYTGMDTFMCAKVET